MECLNCKMEVEQTPKKRAKLYCSEKCRIEFFRKKKPKGKPGRPKKEAPIEKRIDPVEIQRQIAEAQERFKNMPRLKMPRLKGSKNKPKVESECSKGILHEANRQFEAGERTPGDYLLTTEKLKAAVERMYPEETPYPSNWGEMGKIQKLEWLTAQKAKK